jgi:predicted nucleic acid-binding protein
LIILDSSFLVAFHNSRDSHHSAAAAAMEQFLAGHWGGGLLLEYVFLEVVTVLLVRRDLATAARTGRILLEARELEFVPCSDLFPETMEKFSRQTVTHLSFADSAIAAVARNRAEGQLLTFDAEFRKVRGLRVFPARPAS